MVTDVSRLRILCTRSYSLSFHLKYWLVHGCKVDVPSMYRPFGRYRYSYGVVSLVENDKKVHKKWLLVLELASRSLTFGVSGSKYAWLNKFNKPQNKDRGHSPCIWFRLDIWREWSFVSSFQNVIVNPVTSSLPHQWYTTLLQSPFPPEKHFSKKPSSQNLAWSMIAKWRT